MKVKEWLMGLRKSHHPPTIVIPGEYAEALTNSALKKVVVIPVCQESLEH